MGAEPSGQTTANAMKDIHMQCRHSDIKRTLHFMRHVYPAAAKAKIKQVIKNWDVPVNWPSTSAMTKRMIGNKWCVAKDGEEYHPLWWQQLSYPHRPWTHLFCGSATAGTARFSKRSSTAIICLLSTRHTRGNFGQQWQSLLQPVNKAISVCCIVARTT